ncbi:hypothetical protein SBC2_83520 (plasmid) [Caballeronia sp. SBC2]|nr:hypothetical protein SBC2_83520 [Caballeronia sp. SBC2]
MFRSLSSIGVLTRNLEGSYDDVIGHGHIFKGVLLSGRCKRRFPKSYCELLETLDSNGCNNRIPVLEM